MQNLKINQDLDSDMQICLRYLKGINDENPIYFEQVDYA